MSAHRAARAEGKRDVGALYGEAIMNDDELIARYIEPNPYHSSLDAARVRQYGVSVWSIIAHLHAVGDDVTQVAADYDLPSEAVEAAMAYYRRHRDLIDARIVTNAV
jgi:uncharacterized protein (DUF433 family)